MNNAELPLNLRKVMAIIQSAGDENGWMSEEEYERTQTELRKLGVVTTMEGGEGEDEPPATDEHGRTFFEVSIHPFVEQVADKNEKPVDGDWVNPSGSEFSDKFGGHLGGVEIGHLGDVLGDDRVDDLVGIAADVLLGLGRSAQAHDDDILALRRLGYRIGGCGLLGLDRRRSERHGHDRYNAAD